MATEALAALVVKLQVQSAQYQQRLDQANDRVRRFERQQNRSTRQVQRHFTRLERAQHEATERMGAGLKKLGGAMVAFASVNAFKDMVTNAIDAANAMDDFSRRIGISVESLSRLQFVAESNGITLRELETSLQRMTRRSSEAGDGLGVAVKAFKSLNLSAKDMASLKPDEQLRAIAKATEGIANQGDRLKIFVQIFDTEGAKMLQMAEGLEAAEKQAKSLGFTISTDMAKSATEFNAKIVELKTEFKFVTMAVAQNLLPILREAVKVAKGLAGWTKDLLGLQTLDEMKSSYDELATKIEDAQARAAKTGGTVNLSVIDAWRDKQNQLLEKIIATTDAQKELNKQAGNEKTVGDYEYITPKTTASGSKKKPGAGMIGDAEEDALSRKIGKMQEANFRIEDGNKQSAQRRLDQLITSLSDEEMSIKDSMDRRISMAEELGAALNKTALEQAHINGLIRKKASKDEEEAEKDKLQAKLGIAGSIAGEMSRLAETENSKLIEVSRGAAIVQATISGAAAYMKALELGPIAGPIMAGVVAAQTAVQIATIAGARAKGGPVTGGKNYLVGEKGPEIFQAPSSGNIIPNGAAPGVNVTIIEDASKAGQVTQNGQDVQVYVAAAMAQLHSQFNSGTGLFAAMEGRYGLSR